MKSSVFNEQDDLKLKESVLPRLVKAVLALEKCKTDQVEIHFVTKKKISSLHKKFFNDSSLTDCISFPIDGRAHAYPHHVLGMVFVCPYTAIRYCKKNGGDPYVETTLYVVHGLLHLLGFDDMNDKGRKKMRAAEKRHMKNLKEKGLILVEN